MVKLELETDSEKLGYLQGVLSNIVFAVKHRSSTYDVVAVVEESLRRIRDETDIEIAGNEE